MMSGTKLKNYPTFHTVWTAKALTTNPGSRSDIRDLGWSHSVPFEWSSRQLMDLGLMEPGQWF